MLDRTRQRIVRTIKVQRINDLLWRVACMGSCKEDHEWHTVCFSCGEWSCDCTAGKYLVPCKHIFAAIRQICRLNNIVPSFWKNLGFAKKQHQPIAYARIGSWPIYVTMRKER